MGTGLRSEVRPQDLVAVRARSIGLALTNEQFVDQRGASSEFCLTTQPLVRTVLIASSKIAYTVCILHFVSFYREHRLVYLLELPINISIAFQILSFGGQE